jgi:hypothetical protein
MLSKYICIYCLLFVVNLFHMAKKVLKFHNYNFILFEIRKQKANWIGHILCRKLSSKTGYQ